MNPFSILRTVNQALKNRERFEERFRELQGKPVIGESRDSSAKAYFNLETGRFASIEGSGPAALEAVNAALDQADQIWTEFEE